MQYYTVAISNIRRRRFQKKTVKVKNRGKYFRYYRSKKGYTPDEYIVQTRDPRPNYTQYIQAVLTNKFIEKVRSKIKSSKC